MKEEINRQISNVTKFQIQNVYSKTLKFYIKDMEIFWQIILKFSLLIFKDFEILKRYYK